MTDDRRRARTRRSSGCARRTTRSSARSRADCAGAAPARACCSCSAAGSPCSRCSRIWLRGDAARTPTATSPRSRRSPPSPPCRTRSPTSSRPRSTRAWTSTRSPAGAARPRRRARAGDRARRAVGDQRPDRRVHALRSASRTLWVEANRRAHTRVVELLDGRALEAARARRRHALPRPLAVGRPRQDRRCRSAGWTGSPPRSRRPSTAGSRSCSPSALVDAQRGVRLLKAVAIILPILALLCLVGSVLLARDRGGAGSCAPAIGVAVAMLLLIAALAVGPLGLPRRARPGRAAARRGVGDLRHAGRASCATACGSWSSPRSGRAAVLLRRAAAAQPAPTRVWTDVAPRSGSPRHRAC